MCQGGEKERGKKGREGERGGGYAEEVPKRKKTRRELKDLGSVRVTMNGESD